MPQALHILDQVSVVAFAAVTVLAARSDWSHFVIPNRLSLAIVGIWALHASLLIAQGHSLIPLAWAVAIALAVFLIGVGLFAANLLGGGDVKLLAAATLWAAPDHFPQLITIVTVSGAVLGLAFLVPGFGNRPQEEAASADLVRPTTALAGRFRRKTPYGVAIAIGSAVIALKLLNIFPRG